MMNPTRAALAFALALLPLAGCPERDHGIVGCSDSTVCAITAGGQCIPAPVGFDVCAYPSAECPSGLAWSPEAGDLAGVCVASEVDAGSIDARQPDASPGGPDGMWSVTWTCASGCITEPRPSLTYSDLLTINGVTLAWRATTCVDCNADHAGTRQDNCIVVPGAVEGMEDRLAYSACVDDSDMLRTTIGVIHSGSQTIARWEAVAVRR